MIFMLKPHTDPCKTEKKSEVTYHGVQYDIMLSTNIHTTKRPLNVCRIDGWHGDEIWLERTIIETIK